MMKFDTVFRILSYAAVFCGFAALWVSGTFGIVETILFVSVFAAAWFLEGKRWQISEYLGTAMIVLALPVFYAGWKYGFFGFVAQETVLPGILARLILTLTAIKLLQQKGDRDWIFLYLMSFFEVLLAAGLSISALYLLIFILYAFLMVCSIILFEMRRSSVSVRLKANAAERIQDETVRVPMRRLPATAFLLISVIIVFAVPVFFMLPRVGGAGVGGDDVNTSSGFSDTVRLGGIGTIQQNDAIVMRVRFEDSEPPAFVRWRGIALDTFDNLSWRRSQLGRRAVLKDETGLIRMGTAGNRTDIVTQTIFLEPLDTSYIFGLSRIVAIQGNFHVLLRDRQDSLIHQSNGERLSYRAVSDVSRPPDADLRADRRPYPMRFGNYLQLPEIDPRIAELTEQVIGDSTNRYDSARRVEQYLQTQFGYTLEMKAGGEEPLADFLFNVREGHCEYFATAMAIMLRTHGIATRVVNGFSRGEYNEMADVWVVRQRNAHSWVEVYFPGENAWVQFDPTPVAGQDGAPVQAGIAGGLFQYIEALETLWIQYVVAFDDQGQRTLMTSVRRKFSNYQESATNFLAQIRDAAAAWWSRVRGDEGVTNSLVAMAGGVLSIAVLALSVLIGIRLYRAAARSEWLNGIRGRLFGSKTVYVVEFYERLLKILESKGFVREPHQTPLEFAYSVNIPEAVAVTEKYNSVRFGSRRLSGTDIEEIEGHLTAIDSKK